MRKTDHFAEAKTPNQVVAYNLRAARRLRGWTQEEAASELERFLGVRWSKATFSAAERSSVGERTREFTADELLAFAQAFRVPIGWFFLPMTRSGYAISSLPGATVADADALDPIGLLELLFPRRPEEFAAQVAERLEGLGFEDSGRSDTWQVVHDHLVALIIALANEATGGASDRRARLRRAMVAVDAVADLFDAKAESDGTR